MAISLSHFEIKVRDLPKMEEFYTGTLGFLVTDRSPPGSHQMVFLSCDAGEHHQIVLAESESGDFFCRVDCREAIHARTSLPLNDEVPVRRTVLQEPAVTS